MEKKILKFSDHKEEIIRALNERAPQHGIQEPTSLVDGFINQPIQKEFTGGLVIGGPAIPMVAIVGNNSGRIYFFALKVLLPDLEM